MGKYKKTIFIFLVTAVFIYVVFKAFFLDGRYLQSNLKSDPGVKIAQNGERQETTLLQQLLSAQQLQPTPDPYPEEVYLLPDLSIIQPEQLYIVNLGSGQKVLRFSTTFTNIGEGPLEIYGQHDQENKTTTVRQYINKKDGEGVYTDVGTFVLHPTHGHWHVENHVLYQIWSLNELNQRQDLLSTTDKMSFCIWDENPYDLNLEGAPSTRVYTWDCDEEYQGLSVGWSDTYVAQIEGQEIDISGLRDGTYILRYEVNPDVKMVESDYTNNFGEVYITIEGNRLSVSKTIGGI